MYLSLLEKFLYIYLVFAVYFAQGTNGKKVLPGEKCVEKYKLNTVPDGAS